MILKRKKNTNTSDNDLESAIKSIVYSKFSDGTS